MNSTQILYVGFTIISGLLTSSLFSPNQVYQTLTKPVLSRSQLSILSSIISEYSVFLLAFKIYLIYNLDTSGNSSWILTAFIRLDVAVCLVLWATFLQAVFSRFPIYEATKFMRNSSSTSPPSLFKWSFWFRFSNPFWASRSLLMHESISYASEKEVKDGGPGAKNHLSLDVFQHPSFPRNCPVVIYIHGGLWKSNSKQTERPPLLSFLALKRYVVVSINYRLAPRHTIQDQLIDVKRAIRWTKENIVTFGGDPSFIALVGADSGAHLASLASMTINDPDYQPGFESVDTSIQACCSIAGFYDLTRNWGYSFSDNFAKTVLCKDGQLKKTDDEEAELLRIFSPTWRLKEAESNKSRVAATEEEKLGPIFPPFLIIHGTNDCLAPINHVRDFKKSFLHLVSSRPECEMTMIELPGCPHDFYRWSNPKNHTIPYGIEPFIRHCHEKQTTQKKDL